MTQRIEQTNDNKVIYRSPSRSMLGAFRYVVIDLDDGQVECSCPDFQRHWRNATNLAGLDVIDVEQVKFHCFHVEEAIRDCWQRGDIIVEVPYTLLQKVQNA